MKITQTSKDKLSHSYTVLIPANDISQAVDKKLSDLGKTVNLPGFRPGKVPLDVLRKRYRKEVLGEVLQNFADDSSQKIITDDKLEAATQPQMTLKKFEDGKNLEFTVTIDLKPDFALGDLKSIKIDELDLQIDDGEIKTMLSTLAEEAGDSKPITQKRACHAGDTVRIDFEGFKDGVAFPGGKAEGFMLKLGSNSMIPGFEEEIIGKKAGENFRFDIIFPKDYQAEDLAGQAVEFKIALHDIEEAVPAEINDALAEKYGQKDIDGLKTAIKSRLMNNYHATIWRITKRQIFDEVERIYDFELPENLVAREFESIWQQFEQLKKSGNVEDMDIGRSEEEMRTEYQMIAQRRMRSAFFIDKFSAENDIIATEQEIDQLIQMEANRSPQHTQQIVNYYQQNPIMRKNLAAPILEDKAINVLIEKVTKTKRSLTPDALTALDKQSQNTSSAAGKKPQKKSAAAKKSNIVKNKTTQEKSAKKSVKKKDKK